MFQPLIADLIGRKLFMTHEEMASFVARYAMAEDLSSIPTYQQEVQTKLKKLNGNGINLTVDYDDTEIPDGSVAFHMIKGPIMYNTGPFFFSTRQFREDVIRAENNPQIAGHFFLVNSGGGDAYYLDVAAQAMKEARKPKLTLIERIAASAGAYLYLYGGKVYAQTPNEITGSIGTMVSGLDLIPLLEAMGAKWIEENSNLSDRKNAKTNGLLKDNQEEKEKFIADELDPLAQQFRDAVKDGRPATANLPKDGQQEHPLFRGETYRSQEAIDLGLIDGIMLMEEAVQEIARMAQEYRDENSSVSNALKLIT